MVVNESGLNENGVEAAVQQVISGGADIHLLTDPAEFTDGEDEILSKSDASESVDEDDFTISFASSFTDTTEVVLNTDVEYGSLDIGTVFNVVVLGSDGRAFIGIESNEPTLTGEDFTIPSGETVYEIGNVV